MIGLFFLVARQGFLEDLILPAVVIVVIFALIGNQLLNKFGWTLW